MPANRILPGSLTHNVRLLAPLCALLSFAVLALVLAAQAGLSFCDRRVAIEPGMPGMPGMSMVMLPDAGTDQIMICPVVLILIVASTVLAAAAIVILWLDPDRAFTRSSFAHAMSGLPVIRSAAALVAFGAVAIGTMIAFDGNGVPDGGTCVALGLLMICGALAAVGASTAVARVAIALGERLLVAIVTAIAARRIRKKIFARRAAARHGAGASPRFVAAPLGLRAPPSFVR